jgi:hypothetical protein
MIHLLALGHTNPEIAKMLFISVRTADTHRSHIMRKLQLETTRGARHVLACQRRHRPERRLDGDPSHHHPVRATPMVSGWRALPYEPWSACCETLHAHTQVLGKLAAALAPPEPQLQHAALRLSARGWETLPLPAPDGSGAIVAALDLRLHEAIIEHSDGRVVGVPLVPNRSVAEVTLAVLAAVRGLGGPMEINPTPQETTWTTPLDEDEEHATYEPAHVAAYFAAATQAALVLAALRAPYRGRSTPVNAWWGSFDLAVSLYSGLSVDPPAADFITRNAGNAEQIEIGWWPGDARYPNAAFYAYAHPAPEGFAAATLTPPEARWEAVLGEYILDWDDVRASPSPHQYALEFARSAVRHACAVCRWDPDLSGSVDAIPPPVA